MWFETLCIIGLLFLILVFFYKQAVAEFRIVQTDSLTKVPPLLKEMCPIVVNPAPYPPTLWTRKDIQERPTLGSLKINKHSLSTLLLQPSVPLKPSQAETVANSIGLPLWVRTSVTPTFKEAAWWTPILQARTEVAIGSQGLRPTFAHTTLLMATEGSIQVSLLHEKSNEFLPNKWLDKRLSKMTRDDAPLLGNIQYVDVIVRPGTTLVIPPHWKVCWETIESKEAALAVWIEYHHPISSLMRKLFYKSNF